MDDRIRTTLEFVRSRLDASFQNPDSSLVVLSNFVDADGSPNPLAKNKVVLFLANIEHESMVASHQATRPSDGGRFLATRPPLYINLSLLVAANFTEYDTSLDAISQSIAFFHQHSIFDAQNAPDLDPSIERIAIEMQNLDTAELGQVAALAGITYVPMVMYRIRMVSFDDEMIATVVQVT